MTIVRTTLASQLKNQLIKTNENISVFFISKDNKSFCINVSSSNVPREDGSFPNEVILTEKPLDNYKVIARVVSDEIYSKKMFGTKCRVIANSIEDKLKSFAILNELRNCL